METVRGRVQAVEVLGDVSATYCVVLGLEGGGSRVFRFAATGRDLHPAPGDLLEVRVAGNPAGDEVLLCRNLSTRRVLVDRVNYQADRISCWALGIPATLILLVGLALLVGVVLLLLRLR